MGAWQVPHTIRPPSGSWPWPPNRDAPPHLGCSQRYERQRRWGERSGGLSDGLDFVRRANLDELGVLHQKMQAIVTAMPGFISVKMFTAEDGEVLALAELDSFDPLQALDAHPQH